MPTYDPVLALMQDGGGTVRDRCWSLQQANINVSLSNRLTSLLASPSILPFKKANINVFQLQID